MSKTDKGPYQVMAFTPRRLTVSSFKSLFGGTVSKNSESIIKVLRGSDEYFTLIKSGNYFKPKKVK
jgi:hypothetical protein